MIDKYLRNDSSAQHQKSLSKKKFLLKKEEESELAEENHLNSKMASNKLQNNNEITNKNGELNENCTTSRSLNAQEGLKSEINSVLNEKIINSPLKLNPINKLELCDLSPLETLGKRDDFNTNTDRLENEDNSDDKKFINYENIYLNEGRIRDNLKSNNTTKELNAEFDRQNYYGDIKDQILNKRKDTINIPTLTSISKEKEFIEPYFNRNYNENIADGKPLDTLSNATVYDKNEFKLKRLQENIEAKIREEYKSKIKKKEREAENKAKIEFEETMIKLKDNMMKNFDEEKEKLEEDLRQKWQEKYEDLVIDCKSKLRDDKEQKLAINMYHKLKPNIENEIYKNEYSKVEVKIRKEIESKVNQEIQDMKIEEIEKVKQKLENFTKIKLGEIEKNIKSKCKDEMELELKKKLEQKEKETKTNFLRKFENFKNNLEKQLKDEYESKKRELVNEIDAMKANIYRQKCAEKIKMNKLKNFNKTLLNKEKKQFENAEKLEKALNTQNFLDNSNLHWTNRDKKRWKNEVNSRLAVENYGNYLDDLDSYDNLNISLNKNINKKHSHQKNNSQTIDREDNSGKINERQFNKTNSKNPNNEEDLKIDITSKSHRINFNREPKIAVNLMEINKKLKFSPLSINSSDIMSPQGNHKREISLIIKESNTSNLNLKEKLNQLIADNSKLDSNTYHQMKEKNIETQYKSSKTVMKYDENKFQSPNSLGETNKINYKKIPPEKELKDKNIQSPSNKMIQTVNKEKEIASVINCLSLKINSVVPKSFRDFGGFLVKYIENEENYKILFEKEQMKLKLTIKKLLEDENTSDHCLMEYIAELWDKLDISFCNRYKILVELSKSNANEIYQFLDKETEYLTDFFQKSEDTLLLINQREKLKSKLQFKANKNVLTAEDNQTFKLLTKEVENRIKSQKQKYGLNIIWKGLNYELLLDYENWFYSNIK